MNMKKMQFSVNTLVFSLCLIIFVSVFLFLEMQYKNENVEDEKRFYCGTKTKDTDKSEPLAIKDTTLRNQLLIGKTLWEGNCTSCHGLTDETVVGPGLREIGKRRDINWLVSFVKNSQKVIKSGDEYALNLFNKYNKAVMTSFDFTDEEIKAIFAYIEQVKV